MELLLFIEIFYKYTVSVEKVTSWPQHRKIERVYRTKRTFSHISDFLEHLLFFFTWIRLYIDDCYFISALFSFFQHCFSFDDLSSSIPFVAANLSANQPSTHISDSKPIGLSHKSPRPSTTANSASKNRHQKGKSSIRGQQRQMDRTGRSCQSTLLEKVRLYYRQLVLWK